jgi:hypothetical protein
MSDDVGTALICAVLGVGFVVLPALFAWLWIASSRDEKERVARWRDFAAERRGTVNGDVSSMTIERNGCRVEVEQHYDRSRRKRVTTFTAPVLGGQRAPRFLVMGGDLGSLEGPRSGIVAMAVSMMGGPDRNEAGTEARWTARARSAMASKFQAGWAQSDGAVITLSIDGTLDLARIDDGIDLVATLAAPPAE